MNLKFRCGSLDWVFVAGWMDGQCQSLAIRNLITSTETELGENGDERDKAVGEVEKHQQQQQRRFTTSDGRVNASMSTQNTSILLPLPSIFRL
ncbi:hypothetical protein ACLKA7_008347 [Drosophila subpalustris]